MSGRSSLFSCHAFAKSFYGHEECLCNKKGRKQVEVYLYKHRDFKSASIKCSGELSDESWIRLEMNPSGEMTMESIMQKVNEILTVWDFVARNNREGSVEWMTANYPLANVDVLAPNA